MDDKKRNSNSQPASHAHTHKYIKQFFKTFDYPNHSLSLCRNEGVIMFEHFGLDDDIVTWNASGKINKNLIQQQPMKYILWWENLFIWSLSFALNVWFTSFITNDSVICFEQGKVFEACNLHISSYQKWRVVYFLETVRNILYENVLRNAITEIYLYESSKYAKLHIKDLE